WDKVIPEGCKDDDCVSLWKHGRECNFPMAIPCIPLAVIYDYTPGQDLDPKSIRNVSDEILLPSTMLMKRVIDCILHKLPLKDYTVIDRINWTHGQDYACHDFMRLFVGHEHQEGFQVQFSRPLDRDGISKRTFQLMVVYRDRPSEPRHVHV